MVYTEIFFANELVSGLGWAEVWTFTPPPPIDSLLQ